MKREEIIGCIAELRNGERGFIIPIHGTNFLAVSGEKMIRAIDFDYKGDAILEGTRITSPDCDIVKIYKLASTKLHGTNEVSILDYITNDSTYTATIYKDKSVATEMTLKEIENVLGHKVKIVS